MPFVQVVEQTEEQVCGAWGAWCGMAMAYCPVLTVCVPCLFFTFKAPRCTMKYVPPLTLRTSNLVPTAAATAADVCTWWFAPGARSSYTSPLPTYVRCGERSTALVCWFM